MNVFILTKKAYDEIEEMKVFKSKTAAVNFVINNFKDMEHDETGFKLDIKMIEKTLNDNNTFFDFDDYGNDSITWQIYETELEG